jgi:hypothetical protein
MNTASVENHKNPFPGLRPFREDEEYLFFGRENQVDAMVDKLAATHFLAVVGTSGSGKSSLVNCGLRPALHGGLMARAGTSWRMAQFRPGNDPMRALARALAKDGVLFRDYQAGGLTLAEIVDTTLRMSKLGLIDIYEQAQLGEDVNLLVVVDQFEELFRYRQVGAGHQENVYGISEEAAAFVNLLLEVKAQATHPIYVVLTMRSDFLGDCAQFTGLAEAINGGQYLVPRMTRDERRAAISGPVGVGGAEISPVLLTRLVNDVGDNPDQLSILQHALNRTWSAWESSGEKGPLGLPHYDLIGTMAHALDQHAEKAYAELTTARQRQICEKLFKALTDKATDPRGVRRPATMEKLCALTEATPVEITQVIDVFREPSRSFLMPPADDTLGAETVIDISHESLMRVWDRLKTWADEEAQSAHIYRRLAETAVLHGEGKAGLWDNPELQVALDWKEKNQPNKDWAQRYDPGFEKAIAFLQKSKEADEVEVAEVEFGHKMRNVRNVIIGLFVIAWLVDPLNLAHWSLSDNELLKPFMFNDQLVRFRLQVLAKIPEIFRILVHFLGYFVLLFALGAIYRRFAFDAIGSGGGSALPESPFWIRWRNFQVRVHTFLDRFQSPRSKFVFSLSLLLAGAIFFGFGLPSFIRNPESMLRHGVPIGLILILLLPPGGILKTARFKLVQGVLLQIGGVYALTGLFLLFFSTEGWGPSLLLIQKRWVLALSGIGLIILGKWKCELTAEESLALQPNRAPVLHFRSFGSDKQNRRDIRGWWIRRFLRPNDEQILCPIFGALGPFATFAYREEQSGAVAAAGAVPDAIEPETAELMGRSALVILQIDNRLTYSFLSRLRQLLRILKPNQVLVYFSQKIEPAKLNDAYQKFVNETRDVFATVLPPAIEANRFLAFDDDWQPFLCGSLTTSRFSWGKLVPLLGYRLEVARKSRATARALRPFFERRNLVDPHKRLFGDRAIGLSSFFWFDLGFPAGVMIFRNLWIMRRRWLAPIGLVAPLVGIIATYFLILVATLLIGFMHEALTLETLAFGTMIFLGFPFATYWLWRRLSGREIRQHIAFGGDTQPLWKVILVLVLAGGWFLAFVVLILIGSAT